MRTGDAAAKEAAAKALYDSRFEGGGSEDAKEEAAGALMNLADNAAN